MNSVRLLQDIAQIDECEREQMKAEKIDLLALKPNQQTLEFVDPGKGSFGHEALFVLCYRTENPFAYCGAADESMGKTKLTGTRNPSRSAYWIARSPI